MQQSQLWSNADPSASWVRLRADLDHLAAKGIFLGTSSWKYPGWIGSIYTNSTYQFRGTFSEQRFRQRCLGEYTRLFPTVGVDATYYTLPTTESVRRLAAGVPERFQFSFKVTDEFTVKRFPVLARHGSRAGQPNPHFLDAASFLERFLDPLEAIRGQVGLIVFEFSRFQPMDFQRGRDFLVVLDAFLARLPAGWRYAVELRNRNLLHPELLACLASRGVAYTFNLWSNGLSLETQLNTPGTWSTSFAGARLLTRPGTDYETRVRQLSPYAHLQESFPEARAGAVRLIHEALARGTKLYLYFGNKLEGCAPASLAGVVEEWRTATKTDHVPRQPDSAMA